MELVYVAHCVAWPPDKGDRIRVFHSVRELVKQHNVHLACIARSEEESKAESYLRDYCSSVKIKTLDRWRALARGLTSLARGGSFTTKFFYDPELHAHIRAMISAHPIEAAVLSSSAMAGYALDDIPFLADWGDVDSEKRLEYARLRVGGVLHSLEGRRLRQVEREYGERSHRTFLTTLNELNLYQNIAPEAPAVLAGNGVDADFFAPISERHVPEKLRNRNMLLFVGVMSYYPNADGASRFAHEIFPALRQRDPSLELFLVGRNPSWDVMQLAKLDGVTVTGAVPDVRPYLASARAAIAPLRIARGIQNKVLEALAMGKAVLASEEVCRTFHPDLPFGVKCCVSTEDYIEAMSSLPKSAKPDLAIAEAARQSFSWSNKLAPLLAALASIEARYPRRLPSRSRNADGRPRPRCLQ